METLKRPKILFLSQQQLLRETLQANFSIIGEVEFLPPVSTTEEAIESIRTRHPNTIVIDLNPSLFGLKVIKELREACPECAVLMLTSQADPVAEKQLSLAGVNGVLSKNIGIQDLIRAVQEVSAGKRVSAAGGGGRAKDLLPKASPLTGREAEVLELIANGLANKQIASELGISIKTVEKHRQRVMCKLNAHETAGLTWRAICMGVARGSAAGPFLYL